MDVLARVLGLRFESGPADPTSGVPITSWIEREDSDMDKVGVSNRPLGEVPARLGMSGSDMAEDLTIVEPAVAMVSLTSLTTRPAQQLCPLRTTEARKS